MSASMSNLLGWIRANLWIAVIGLVVVIFLLLRTSPTDGIDSVEALDSALGSGQPVVIEFYSNL